MKAYCYNCGSKMEFSIKDKPSFCAKCGTSLDGAKNETQASPASEEPEDDKTTSIPDIAELDFEFDQFSNRTETLGSLVGTLDKDQVGKYAIDSPKITSEEAMEQFKKEAGQLRQSPMKKDDQA